MEYFALVVPLIAIVVGFLFFKEKFTWWESTLPLWTSILIIIVCKLLVKTALVTDTEYWGSLVTKARYYEYWETWVSETCSRQVPCGTDKDGHTQYCTEYYDCSHCDENSAYWKAYDDAGNSWNISQEYYNYLKNKWSSQLQFVELNRSITTHWGCGKDGDAYDIFWNSEIMTSEAAVTEHNYTNKVQASHSAFKLPYISEKVAKQRGLYPYPRIHDYYKQNVFFGLDSIYSPSQVNEIEQKFQYFNGHYGHLNKVKLFVLVFYNKPLSIAFDQEAYWDGGNQNELVVCMSLDRSTQNIQWVKPFSWTDRKRVLIDCREDIAGLGKFNPQGIYNAIENAISSNDIHKDFKKDFSYLTVDLPLWSMWVIWMLTITVTSLVFRWCITNDYENDQNKNQFDLIDWVKGKYEAMRMKVVNIFK